MSAIAILGVIMVCASLSSGAVVGGATLITQLNKIDGDSQRQPKSKSESPPPPPKVYKYYPPENGPEWGGMGGGDVSQDCKEGAYLNYVQFWHGNKNLDGIYAQCVHPVTGETYPLWTFGEDQHMIGRATAPKSFWDKLKTALKALASVAMALFAGIPGVGVAAVGAGSLMNQLPTDGGKPYPFKDLHSPRGFTKVKVWTDGKEIRGLEMISPENISSTPGGNTEGAPIPITFECKNNQVMTGIKARSGRRIDRIGFKCSTIRGKA